MILEFRLRQNQWVDLLPLVQANLNQTPVQSLGHLSPIEAFSGMSRLSPLKTIVATDSEGEQVHHFEEMSNDIVTKSVS
ncbi:hypothetical protein PC116_g5843 [Phytophthora cactorum]|nr:hypothetical protein Pcac1_g5429 [Phytophthora cactorum]KAG3002575.1 hypothetical protein PC119_g16260 [Phytophthora cactorum]KAG3028459.1 hypothetical protein PC120_g4864 [Phytophthora cactorum]KAG3185243.1 hypothetical protein C6341_g4571 [Phytophthora cactorum]KAG3198733.1 hypothetical protein PC128_g5787 [Phytophthora cactorum]